MKHILRGSILLLAVVALLWYAFRPLPVSADIGSVERGALHVTLSHEGKTRVKDRYVIHAPLSGRLRRIGLDPGDAVHAGSTELAVIDPLEPALLDDRALATAEARVRSAEASLEMSERQHRKALDQARLARAEFQRGEELSREGDLSRQQLERSERELRLWEGEVGSAESASKVARFELAMAEAALLRSRPPAERGGEVLEPHLALRSPIDGRVFRLFRESAGPVLAGEPLLELGDTQSLEIVADFLSTDAVQMRPGMEAEIRGWGGAGPLTARVRLIEPSGFTKISALGVEEQRVNVILDMVDDRDERPPLGDGYRVEAGVILWRSDDVLKIPEAGLFRHGDGWAVFHYEGGRARLVAVRVGQRNGYEAELLDGLDEGAEIVLHPSDAIEDGVRVGLR